MQDKIKKARRKIEKLCGHDYAETMIKCEDESESDFLERKEAVMILHEAITRLRENVPNKSSLRMGGVYWRVAKTLCVAEKRMNECVGVDHAEFVRRAHGRLVK